MKCRVRNYSIITYIAIFLTLVAPEPILAQGDGRDYQTARLILAARCSFCHTALPQEDGLNATSQPPAGVTFDTAADIRKFAPRILLLAVKSRLMPPDNATHMSNEERALLGKWIEAGARTP